MRQFSAWIGCIEFNLRKVPSGSQTPKIRSLRQPGVPSMIDSLEVKVLYPT